MPIAGLLIPLIPGLVKTILDIVNAIQADPTTPEDVKAQLDQISLDLNAISFQVQNVQLPDEV